MRRAGANVLPPRADQGRRVRAIPPGLLAWPLWAAAALLSCDAGAPERGTAGCPGSLSGLWRVEGAVGAAPTWAILDLGARAEVYAAFDDAALTPASGEPPTERAPRHLELVRVHSGLVGHVDRRIARGQERCAQRAPARISSCAGDSLELTLGRLPEPGRVVLCPAATSTEPERLRLRRVR